MAAREPELFAPALTVAVDGGRVTGSGRTSPACKPHRLQVRDGRWFVAKHIDDAWKGPTGPISSLRAMTEFVVARWAPHFQVRVPSVEFLDFDGESWVGSEDVGAFEPVSDETVAHVTPRDAVSRLLVLDTFIGNHDRHEGIALFLPSAGAPRSFALVAFDHERSALGLHDVEGDFTPTYASVATFSSVLARAVSTREALKCAKEVRRSLAPAAALVPVTASRAWCRTDVSWLAPALTERLKTLPDLVARVCSQIGASP